MTSKIAKELISSVESATDIDAWFEEIQNYKPTFWEKLTWRCEAFFSYVRYDIRNGIRGLIFEVSNRAWDMLWEHLSKRMIKWWD